MARWWFGKGLPKGVKRPGAGAAMRARVPVYLTYFTPTPTEKGFGFLKDVYGRDRKVG